MLRIPDIVKEIVTEDEQAREMLGLGLLNVSAYAQKIQKKVEDRCIKPVRAGTIAVALSRMQNTLKKTPPLTPQIIMQNLSFQSSLSALSYEKTPDMQRKIATLHPFALSFSDLFAVVEGPTEIMIICTDRCVKDMQKQLKTEPKDIQHDLVALTAQISKELKQTPNVLYTLLRPLAAKRITILEVITTYTQISFIVKKDDLQEAFTSLNLYFSKKKTL